MNKLIAITVGFSLTSLLLIILKLVAATGLSWIWVFMPIWFPTLIVVIPWLVTVTLLWIHEEWGD